MDTLCLISAWDSPKSSASWRSRHPDTAFLSFAQWIDIGISVCSANSRFRLFCEPGRHTNGVQHEAILWIRPRPSSSDNVRVRAGFGPGSKDSNQTLCRTFRAFLGHYFFRKGKPSRICAHLVLVTQSGSGHKSHRLDFLAGFRSWPLPEIVLDTTIQIGHPINLYRSSNAKITWGVSRATLNNSFNEYWHLIISDTTVRADRR
jgi:hypothetical protein